MIDKHIYHNTIRSDLGYVSDFFMDFETVIYIYIFIEREIKRKLKTIVSDFSGNGDNEGTCLCIKTEGKKYEGESKRKRLIPIILSRSDECIVSDCSGHENYRGTCLCIVTERKKI